MLDTQKINQARSHLIAGQAVWLFGYASLIYKADFPYLERKPAYIKGWQRRLWQGSHDHRGTPAAPGRVATLIAQEGVRCVGMAYKVTAEVFTYLDHREKNGYLRFETPFYFMDGSAEVGLVYRATEDNQAYLGPASDAAIAAHIAQAAGPSGPNDEYVLKLAKALRHLQAEDEHIFAVEAHLLKYKTDRHP